MSDATIGDLQRMIGWSGVACYLVGSFTIGYRTIQCLVAAAVWIARSPTGETP